MQSPKEMKKSLIKRLRNYLFSGILITVPITFSLYVGWVLIQFVDGFVHRIIPQQYNPFSSMPYEIPGLGIIIVITCFISIGMLMTGMMGRVITRLMEYFVMKIPVIKTVYITSKQIFESVFSQQSQAFRQVALIEYPRKGVWCIGFLTGETEGEIQDITKGQMLNVFLPTTPNPTSGFLLFVPKKDTHILNMTVEEGIKMVISGGILAPEDKRSEVEKKKHRDKVK